MTIRLVRDTYDAAPARDKESSMADLWKRYQQYLYQNERLGLCLDISQMGFPPDFFERETARAQAALRDMAALESGAISNPDEKRQVGHYWLRAPELAPSAEQRQEIEAAIEAVETFAAKVHSGEIAPPSGRFRNLLLVGIGGSALGPQLVADALGTAGQPLQIYFLDNTDPDGIARVFDQIGDALSATLTVVASKSGGTKETRNGMLEAEARYSAAGLDFAAHAAAITGAGSELDRHAEAQGWITRFPMWDWVGGRTSVFSAVGLLPAALLGYDIQGFLRGAREMDEATRVAEPGRNPAALLALMWYHAGGGSGVKDMVVLPYKDRLGLFAKYLQQLVMESLGKELDLEGQPVNQGIVVYGNKGSTDQHAYVQQLREGANNFFVTFVEVLTDGGSGLVVEEPGITSGDYLHGFLQGTRRALADNGRESLTITLDHLDAAALGRLIALFERAVGLYAAMIGINAYHQPGVEGGKKAAGEVIKLQVRALAELREAGTSLTAAELAERAGASEGVTTLYQILRHLAANQGRGVSRESGATPAEDRFTAG
jgi:glucose-6-phosphate isomerase